MIQLDDMSIQELFGVEDAENEDPARLKQYFWRNRAYDNLVVGLPIRVLVGHKGVGKSALLKMAYMEDQSEGRIAVWLQPNDLKEIASSRNAEMNTLIEEWKNGIANVIFRKICKDYVSSKTRSDNIIAGSAESLLSSVVDIFSKAQSEASGIMQKSAVNKFLQNNAITVYIDDLDRGWEAQRTDIRRISALLNAVRDLAGHRRSINFRLGLRSDVYFLVRTSDESTDKIEQNILWLTWTSHEILAVIAKRIETFLGREIGEYKRSSDLARFLDPVIESRFHGEGKWRDTPMHRVLLSLTRRRPRDLVKLLSAAARQAHGDRRTLITTTDLRNIFESYSGERLQDIINEFRSELPEIDRLLYGMRPTTKERREAGSYLYSNDRLTTKIRNIMSQATFHFTNRSHVSALSLAEFLYKIDFITARRDGDQHVIRRYFDQSRHLQNQFVDFGFHWEVHPAYRWALQPGEERTIFEKLDVDHTD